MTEPLWTSEEILAAVGGELHDKPFEVSGVTIRKDLLVLESAQRLVRAHGGAIAIDRSRPELSFDIREGASLIVGRAPTSDTSYAKRSPWAPPRPWVGWRSTRSSSATRPTPTSAVRSRGSRRASSSCG